MAKKSKAKEDDTVYNVELYSANVVELEGEILEHDEHQVKIRHKRPRSSKRDISIFPKNDQRRPIIAIYGQVGGAGALLYLDPVARVERNSGTVSVTEDGWMELHPESGGESFVFNPSMARITGASEEETGKGKGKGSTGSSSGKGKAAGKSTGTSKSTGKGKGTGKTTGTSGKSSGKGKKSQW